MRRTLTLIGCVLLLSPMIAKGQTANALFPRLFLESAPVLPTTVPEEPILGIIIDAMRSWGDEGIVLTADDIRAAVEDREDILCTGKQTPRGTSLTIARGASAAGAGTCEALKEAIRSLIAREVSLDALGRDLVSITNGAELAIADEPGRPLSLTAHAAALHRTWVGGTGGTLHVLPTSTHAIITALEQALKSEPDLDRVVRRFRHGFFRDQREADPAVQNVGTTVAARLQDIAADLGITASDERMEGAYAVPPIDVPNVTLWIRRNDLGLLWTFPSAVVTASAPQGGTYPTMITGGETLAYPFGANGPLPGTSIATPLCARPFAREGYLCRPIPPTAPACAPPAGSAGEITLVRCSETQEKTPHGPPLCDGLAALLRRDDGRTLQGPVDPTTLTAFPLAPLGTICDPESGTIYPDDIAAHACFASACIAESLSGHSLVPGRSPVLVAETTSPFLAYQRPDPALGLYAEVARPTASVLPLYEGANVVAAIERAYCARAGNGRLPLVARCTYDDNERTASPPRTGAQLLALLVGESTVIGGRQEDILSFAGIAGARAALQQFVDVQRRAFTTLGSIVEQTASLFLELKRAPLTTDACPWTGPLTTTP